MSKRSEERRAEIERLVAEQESSGLNVARFCRERGISSWPLYDWKQARAAKRKRAPAAKREAECFVEVALAPSSAPPAPLAVELPSGLRVQVLAGFEEDELRRLVGVLSSC
jgi:hypothetical protein